MGISRKSLKVNKLFEWVGKQSKTVQILITVVILISCLVAVNFFVGYRNILFFALAAEIIYSFGIMVLVYKLTRKKTCSGLSLKTQCITAVFLGGKVVCIFVARIGYVIGLTHLAAFLATCWIIYMMRGKLKSTYNRELDDLPLLHMVVPVGILAIVVHPGIGNRIINILWAFSVILSSVSMLPQLRLMQNGKMVEPFTALYVFALGVSRFLGFCYWIIMVYNTGGKYLFLGGYRGIWPVVDFISEFIHSFILADFCYYYVISVIHNRQLMKLSSIH